MTNKGKTLEQLIKEREKLYALINELRCANSELTATAEFVDDDFEDDVFDDTEDDMDYCEIFNNRNTTKIRTRNVKSYPGREIVFTGTGRTPSLVINNVVNNNIRIDNSYHVDNSTTTNRKTTTSLAAGDSAISAIGGILDRLFSL